MQLVVCVKRSHNLLLRAAPVLADSGWRKEVCAALTKTGYSMCYCL